METTRGLLENHYLSDRDLAERFRITRGSIWRWVKNGILPPPVKFSPGCSRWSAETVEAFERSRSKQV